MFDLPKPGRVIERNGATCIKVKKYSLNLDDNYLAIVLALFGGQYVTWIFNACDGGCHEGHYFNTDLNAAIEDFNKRGY